MYCGKCGVKNADDAVFCVGCGEKLNGGQAVSVETPSITTTPNDKNRKVGIIAFAVVIVAVAVAAFALFGGRSYESTVEQFIDATFGADAEAIIELLPADMLDYVLEEEGYDDDELDELIEDLDEQLQEISESIERNTGEDWKISCEILSAEDVTGDDLEYLQDDYENANVEVSAAKTVEVEVTIEGGGMENSSSMDISVIKVGRSWYIDSDSMGGLF